MHPRVNLFYADITFPWSLLVKILPLPAKKKYPILLPQFILPLWEYKGIDTKLVTCLSANWQQEFM